MVYSNCAIHCVSPRIVSLSASHLFSNLSMQQKLFAHYAARAAWYGSRIILRQVSPESSAIFDFILELHRTSHGDWLQLSRNIAISEVELQRFLEYAAVFLGNLGNYYGHGDQKFIPDVQLETLKRLSTTSDVAQTLFSQFSQHILGPQPSALGFPSSTTQSSYYGGSSVITQDEIERVDKVLQENQVHFENTRIHKQICGGHKLYKILQASVEEDQAPVEIASDSLTRIRVVRGDHKEELRQVCNFLRATQENAESPAQRQYIAELRRCFITGDMEVYKSSQRYWLQDEASSVQTVFGFVEPYRDPMGVRAEFEGVVGLVHKDETQMLKNLALNSDQFIARLPWAKSGTHVEGHGQFEARSTERRNFYSLHTIAYCSTLVFPGINLPNYNDIRQECGSKNFMITNSVDGSTMAGDVTTIVVPESDRANFLAHRRHTYYLWVVFHEFFGHGTGKLLSETQPGIFNFDIHNLPTNPLTGKPIDSWYKPSQTWTSLFGDIATAVDECRAECVGAYLMSDRDLLNLCGSTEETGIKPADVEYNMYLQLAVAGLRSLENYSASENKWGQAHSRAHFAMFRTLLNADPDFLKIEHATNEQQLLVQVDRSKIAAVGRPALENLLLQLHIFRCTGDVQKCRTFFESLTDPSPNFLEWRQIVMAGSPAKRIFVQPNTFVIDGDVVVKDYEPTALGMIESWAERAV